MQKYSNSPHQPYHFLEGRIPVDKSNEECDVTLEYELLRRSGDPLWIHELLQRPSGQAPYGKSVHCTSGCVFVERLGFGVEIATIPECPGLYLRDDAITDSFHGPERFVPAPEDREEAISGNYSHEPERRDDCRQKVKLGAVMISAVILWCFCFFGLTL